MGHRILSVSVGASGAVSPAGLKRQTFDQPLSGVDLLVGPNGVGKTTRGPLAITAALEGLASVPTDPRRPYVGALPADTSVTLRVQTPSGVETLTRPLDAVRGKAVTTADQRARDLVGIPPTAWDLRDFAASTSGDRGKILDAVARAGGALERWDAPRAQAHVLSLLPEGLDEGPYHALVGALDAAPDGATWLRAAETWTADHQTRTNAQQREAKGHLDGLLAEAHEAPEGDRAADESRHRTLLQQQAQATVLAEARRRALAAQQRHTAEGERLRAELQRAETEGRRLAQPVQPPDLAALEERVARAEAVQPIPVGELEAQARSAEAALNEARRAQHARTLAEADVRALEGIAGPSAAEIAAQLEGLEEEPIAELEQAARLAHEQGAARAEAEADVAAIERLAGHGATCQHCHAADPLGVDVRLTAARERLAALPVPDVDAMPRLRAAVENAAKAARLRTALVDAQAREQRLADARARLAALPVVDFAAAQAAADRVRDARAQEREQQHEIGAARAELERARAAAAKAETQRAAALADARQRWTAARDALAAWTAATPPEVPDAPPATVDAELRDAEERLSCWRRHDDARRRIGEAAARYERARATWDATRALLDAVRQARDDVAAAAYAPIDRAARELLGGVEGLPQPYFAGPDDYGAVVEGRGRVPYAGLSESEQRITAAALVYALATVAGCPCRLVLLDGLEVVQRDHRAPLVAALARAQRAGRVDSVVLTMATAPGEDLADLAAVATVHVIERAPVPLPQPTPQPAQERAPSNAADNAECPF